MSRLESGCEQVRERLFEAARPPSVADHLRACAACRVLAGDVSAATDAARLGRHEDDLPADFEERSYRALERRLRPAPSRPSRWPWVLGALAASAAAAAVLLVARHPRPPPAATLEPLAAVTRWQGDVAWAPAQGEERAVLERRVPVKARDAVITGEGGRFLLEIGPDRLVGLDSTRLLVASATASERSIELPRGVVVAEVARAPNRGTFRVRTAIAEVTVTGTLFVVRGEPRRSEVMVVRGSVHVRHVGGGEWQLEAGQRLVLEEGGGRRLALDAAKRAEIEAAIDPARWPVADEEATPEAPRPAARPTPRRAAAPEPPAVLAEVQASVAIGRCGEAERKAEGFPRHAARADRAHSLALVADCYHRQGDAEAALRLYGSIAQRFPHTATGENAAYERGRIAQQLGRTAEARRAFASYVERNPGGALAGEARFRSCSLEVEEKRYDQALGCIEEYRRHHPRGERLADAYLLEATVLRTAKEDCRGAIRAYEAYLADPGDYAEQARSWIGWCRGRLAE